jgi:endoglucanase
MTATPVGSAYRLSRRPTLRVSLLGRRLLLLGAPVTLAATHQPAARQSMDQARIDWQNFRDRFVHDDGRVIDTGNGGISHTEGQGWGLLFAEYFDDQDTFDRILRWTSRVLRRPDDALHAWRYRPADAHPVSDSNNATDGDLCIAWALARAARRWGALDHAHAAAAIGRDVLRMLAVRLDGNLLLLPGMTGFERPAAIVVNPSYYVFPAFAEMAALAPSPEWDELQRHGLWLIQEGRFGPWMLPPDWLLVSRGVGELSPAPPWPPRCSFDAIRVPLYLAWAKLPATVMSDFASFYATRAGATAPAWVDLETQAVAAYPASVGMLAVARIAAAVSTASSEPIDFPRVAEAPDYFSAALILLARIAWLERHGA